jgi:EAL domain-containing protein (putative c-di-GMP-specific phosphodiesterase class I)/GGDEF domain-containing protein
MLGRGLTPGTGTLPDSRARLAFAAGYLVIAVAVTLLVGSSSGLTPMFEPVLGLAFGYLALTGIRGLPTVLLGALLCDLVGGGALARPGWLALQETAVALVLAACATLLRRRWDERAAIVTLAWFVLTGLLLAPVGTATSWLVGLWLSGEQPSWQQWATLVVAGSAATATMAPAVLLPVRALIGAATLPAVLPFRVRLETVIQALLLIIAPVLAVISPQVTVAELPSLTLALVPLAWIWLRPDLVRTPLILASASLALGITITGVTNQLEGLFRAQALMLTSALAASFVGATLAADWTSRRDAELAASRWRALVDTAAVVVARVGPDGGWRVDPAGQAADDEMLATVRRAPDLVAALAQRRRASVHWNVGSGQHSRHFVTQLTPLADGETLTVTAETTRVQSAEAALAWERTHDRDSALANRDLLLATAGRNLAEAVPSSLAVIDVGDLSQRAALVGLELADVFTELADRVEQALARCTEPGEQVLLARVGDDQLGVLLPVQAAQAAERTEQVLAALSASLTVGPHRVPIQPTGGVASIEADGEPREALRRAVTAAQSGREVGRGEVVIFDRLAMTSAAERAKLAGEVIAAVERNELEVVFQPDVDLPSGRLAGVEALVRWRRRAGYLAATDLFVQLAEESGAVRQVDAWVLEESLRQLGRWRRSGAADRLELGVNVSALSLTRDLPARLKAACERHHVPPNLVRLEVTETALGDDGDAAWVLAAVRGLGFQVALDDFGTGYASLSRLHRLPIDVLKLDRSFLRTLTEDATSRALVSLVLGLAGPMQVEVLVEGVETEAQRDLLVDLGCRRAQGFLFSRPAPAAVIERLLAAEQAAGPAQRPGRAGQRGNRPARTASAAADASAAPATIALDQQVSQAATSSGRPEA